MCEGLFDEVGLCSHSVRCVRTGQGSAHRARRACSVLLVSLVVLGLCVAQSITSHIRGRVATEYVGSKTEPGERDLDPEVRAVPAFLHPCCTISGHMSILIRGSLGLCSLFGRNVVWTGGD